MFLPAHRGHAVGGQYGTAYVARGVEDDAQPYRARMLKHLTRRAQQPGCELVPVAVTPAAGQ